MRAIALDALISKRRDDTFSRHLEGHSVSRQHFRRSYFPAEVPHGQVHGSLQGADLSVALAEDAVSGSERRDRRGLVCDSVVSLDVELRG